MLYIYIYIYRERERERERGRWSQYRRVYVHSDWVSCYIYIYIYITLDHSFSRLSLSLSLSSARSTLPPFSLSLLLLFLLFLLIFQFLFPVSLSSLSDIYRVTLVASHAGENCVLKRKKKARSIFLAFCEFDWSSPSQRLTWSGLNLVELSNSRTHTCLLSPGPRCPSSSTRRLLSIDSVVGGGVLLSRPLLGYTISWTAI